MANILDLLHNTGISTRRVATTKGGEHSSLCPGCGGHDRFRVWPEENNGHGSYWCRQCGKTGDDIQFCRDFLNMDFKTAAKHCGRENLIQGNRREYSASVPLSPQEKPAGKPDWEPTVYELPNTFWMSKAEEFVHKCSEDLLANNEVLQWLDHRGINEQTAHKYRLGFNQGNAARDLYKARQAWGLPAVKGNDNRTKPLWLPRGLVIPHIIDGKVVRLRIRRTREAVTKLDLKYYVVPGSFMGAMIIDPAARAFVVTEAELDALACSQAAANLAGMIALGSSSTRPDAAADKLLRNALQILVALDADPAGGKNMKWWLKQYRDNTDPWPVPLGKDPGEAYQAGMDLRAWIAEGLSLCPALMLNLENERGSFSLGMKRDGGFSSADLPPEVFDLRNLLIGRPVSIINGPEGPDLRFDEKWASDDPKTYHRIAALVYWPGLSDYLASHPDRQITAENLIQEQVAS